MSASCALRWWIRPAGRCRAIRIRMNGVGSGSIPLGVLEDNVRLWIAQEKARP